MRNKRENAVNHSKTHIQPSGGRKECSDAFKDALEVPICKLQKRKLEKKIQSFSTSVLRMIRFSEVLETHNRRSNNIYYSELMMI